MPTSTRLTCNHPAIAAPLALGGLLLLISACGDDTVIGESATEASSSGTGESTTTTTTTTITTATATATMSGGESDSESAGTTTTTTTTGETTAVSTSDGTMTTTTGDTDTDATTTTTTGDTDTDTTTTTTTGDTTTTTGDTDTDTTTTGGELLGCGDDTLPYAGALCGPPELPCVVVANEAASPEHHFRNEAPAITFDAACDPQILYSVAEGGYHGFFTWREGQDQWTTEATPFEIARVGLAYDYAGDRTLSLSYNGAFGTTLWARSAGVWAQIDAVAGQNIASAHAFARGSDGELHASLYTSNNEIKYATHPGGWTLSTIAGQATASTALALDPDGAPHVTFWRTQGQSWQLTYAAPPAAPEPAFDLGSNVLVISIHGVAAILGDNNPLAVVPYALLGRKAGGELRAVALAHRVSPGTWTVEDVAVEDDQNAKLCNGAPGGPGETCDYDYVRYQPLTIVASAGGDVRFLYAKNHYIGTLQAQCVQDPFPQCFWVGLSDMSEAELWIGWPTPQGPKSTSLIADIYADDMTLAVDANGRFHAAIYDSEGINDSMVRYLAFE